MTFFMRVAAVIAIVAVAGAAALNAFGSGPRLGSWFAPGPTMQPTPTETPTPLPSSAAGNGCAVLEAGSYRASVGAIPLTVTVPNAWHVFTLDPIHIGASTCLEDDDSVKLEVSLASRVPTDACQWQGIHVEAETPEAVTAALAAQEGHETIGPTDVTVAGYPASRFEFSVLDSAGESTACEGFSTVALAGTPEDSLEHTLSPGQTATVYVVDVDGSTLVVAATRDGSATPANLAELDAVVDSLRFEP